MSLHTNSPPVIVIMKANNCPHCKQLFQKWPEIKMQLEKDNLTVRIVQIDLPRMTSPIPVGYPIDLKKFTAWFPMVLMIPGANWDEAMAKLKTSSNYSFPTIEVLNGKFSGSKLDYVNKHNLMNPESFSQWVQSVLAMPEYSHNGSNSHLASSDVDVPQAARKSSNTGKAVRYHPTFGLGAENNDVCSMKLIPKNG